MFGPWKILESGFSFCGKSAILHSLKANKILILAQIIINILNISEMNSPDRMSSDIDSNLDELDNMHQQEDAF